MSAGHRTLLVLIALALLQLLVYWGRLPDVVSSHFDGAGVPNGWSSRTAFFAIYLAMLALIYVAFAVLPAMQSKRFGRHAMALPAAMYESLRTRMLWLGAVHALLALITVQLVIVANLSQRPLSGAMYWLLGAYFVFLIGWLIAWFVALRSARA